MKKQIIKTDKAPLPIGPYNQAVKVNDLVFCSGQIAIDPKTNEVSKGDVQVQARLVLQNLKTVLEAAGSSIEKVVKATIFLKDMNDFPKVNVVYGEFFKADTAPARSTIEVARLPKDCLVEVEAIATV
ncbi:MAG: hypothetical protein A2Z88_09515 [Omnitrophica WOR_2 bacterium GWA2_47_8]|nr:MAG: hypothetical protein A2Z88_09515 [Omnitrophica WOR_2 bacterium GWA2_47_8]